MIIDQVRCLFLSFFFIGGLCSHKQGALLYTVLVNDYKPSLTVKFLPSFLYFLYFYQNTLKSMQQKRYSKIRKKCHHPVRVLLATFLKMKHKIWSSDTPGDIFVC